MFKEIENMIKSQIKLRTALSFLTKYALNIHVHMYKIYMKLTYCISKKQT